MISVNGKLKLSRSELARLIDQTFLKPEATPESIKELCRQAKQYGFAAVCVNPCYVETASNELHDSPTSVCTVIGFPLGASVPAIKAAEAASAVRAGASEIDVVINVGYLKGGFFNKVLDDLEGVIKAARQEKQNTVVKVILETCLLSDREKVEACRLATAVQANFVKTSTGFSKSGATVSDVSLLKQTAGAGVEVKASGGIRNLTTAIAMVNAGASRLGTSSGISILNEI
ncbi:MAG: Deoxyribose-phosphate aldolase [Pelotomaculum thermopropionicum]|uniref:Deoxyribose-phosphate aldolase n=1 Tax=Pelotomaculum thermopropionicum TaxID=110500 RepID=A0A117M379_9FIRM|nr:MAG: Deoxyribose-phosphate aldolase [Pelotomaculum thermopropionicum]